MRTRTKATRITVHLTGHLLALGCVTTALAVLTLDPIHFELLWRATAEPALGGELVWPLATTIGSAVALWGATWAVVVALWRRPEPQPIVLRARGAVLTEVLIVLPVYFTFVFGLAQLTINNIAGLLSTLSSYEAARTLAVWGPEARRDVGFELALDKARVAAASVLAPVVPRDIVLRCERSETLDAHMSGLQSAGNLPVQDIPTFGQTDTLAGSFDRDSMAARGLPKLAKAYCLTEVSVAEDITPGLQFTAQVEYRHPNVVPLAGRFFGDEYVPGVGHLQSIKREYETTAQLRPNHVDPRCRFCPEGVQSPL